MIYCGRGNWQLEIISNVIRLRKRPGYIYGTPLYKITAFMSKSARRAALKRNDLIDGGVEIHISFCARRYRLFAIINVRRSWMKINIIDERFLAKSICQRCRERTKHIHNKWKTVWVRFSRIFSVYYARGILIKEFSWIVCVYISRYSELNKYSHKIDSLQFFSLTC